MEGTGLIPWLAPELELVSAKNLEAVESGDHQATVPTDRSRRVGMLWNQVQSFSSRGLKSACLRGTPSLARLLVLAGRSWPRPGGYRSLGVGGARPGSRASETASETGRPSSGASALPAFAAVQKWSGVETTMREGRRGLGTVEIRFGGCFRLSKGSCDGEKREATLVC